VCSKKIYLLPAEGLSRGLLNRLRIFTQDVGNQPLHRNIATSVNSKPCQWALFRARRLAPGPGMLHEEHFVRANTSRLIYFSGHWLATIAAASDPFLERCGNA